MHAQKKCPFAHTDDVQKLYKEGKLDGYDFEEKKKKAEDMKAKGAKQWPLATSFHLK